VNLAAGKADAQIEKAVAGEWRSADNKARDVYRPSRRGNIRSGA
jgi:hypothetical protein